MISVKYLASYMAVRPEWLPFLFIRLAALAEVNCQPRADPAPTPEPSRDAHPSSSGSGVTSGTYVASLVHDPVRQPSFYLLPWSQQINLQPVQRNMNKTSTSL